MREFLERLFPSLGKKVAIAVILGSLIAWGSFVYYAWKTGTSILEKEAQAKAYGLAALVDRMLDHPVTTSGIPRIEDLLGIVMTSPDIVNTFLVGEKGDVLWYAHPGSPRDSLIISGFFHHADSTGRHYLTAREGDSVYGYVVSPLRTTMGSPAMSVSGTPPPRYFGMKISMADVSAISVSHRSTNILMTIVIFSGMGVLIYLILLVLVINPIRSLHGHIDSVQTDVKKLAHGERTVFPLFRAPKRYDEVAELHKGFNHLLQTLNDANARLMEMRDHQLEQADRLVTVGEMAASMAHEIKNPIAGVLSALQVFSGEMEISDPRQEIMGEMILQLERVIHAVNDLLQYARPAVPVLDVADVNPLIEKTVALLSRQYKGKDITIRTNFTASPLNALVDKKQFQQVLWNHILNAIQAIDNAGTITIETRIDSPSAVIRITDTGKGIDPEHLAEIFKPFFTTKHKGTGLGMTISRRIVEQHHGSVSVTSQPGEGTTVTIALPKYPPEESR